MSHFPPEPATTDVASPEAPVFVQDLADRFESRVASLWRRDGIGGPHPDAAARLLRLLLAEYGVESPQCRRFLRGSGVRDAWNAVLAEARSGALAGWLAPHLAPPVMDVLAGDGSLTRALARRGVVPITATERVEDYPEVEWPPDGVPFEPFDTGALARTSARTVLLCAVLHHEVDPAALLAAVPESVERIVVVENPVTGRAEPDFHEYVDVFFNRCLNEFGASCVPEHRCPEEWVEMLSALGRVVRQDRYEHVPGIPFQYDFFVVEREAR